MSEPIFSIVIPTYDRPRQLEGCLSALARLDYPRDRFEVIVVDDHGPEPLDRVVDPWRDRLDLALVRQPRNAGPATARNAGAERARGELLAFTDDDCQPDPWWLRALAAGLAETPGHMLGGRTVNVLPENPYSAASQALIDFLYDYFGSRRGHFFASNNIAMPAETFRAVGGFDTSFPLAAAEDREFCVRWARLGRPLRYAPEAVVHHAHALDFRRFCRQHFNYGRGAYYFRQLLARGSGEPVRVEPPAFYTDLLRYPLHRHKGPRALGISALFLVSQVANASGFFFELARYGGSAPARGEA